MKMPKRVPFLRSGQLPWYVHKMDKEEDDGGYEHEYDKQTSTYTKHPWRWEDNVPRIGTFEIIQLWASRSAACVRLKDTTTGIGFDMRGNSFMKLLREQGIPKSGIRTIQYDFEKCGTVYFLRYLGIPQAEAQ